MEITKRDNFKGMHQYEITTYVRACLNKYLLTRVEIMHANFLLSQDKIS